MTEEIQNPRGINPKSLILVILIFACGGIFVLLQMKGSSVNFTGKPRLEKGETAPNFSLADLNGNTVRLTDYKGKVVLLNIWATWCPPCVEEMPSMERLHRELKDELFAILAVSIDSSGAEVVVPFMEKYNLSFTTLTDQKGVMKSLYQTTGIPESFIIDKDGTIAQRIIGPRDWAAPVIIQYLRDLSQSN